MPKTNIITLAVAAFVSAIIGGGAGYFAAQSGSKSAPMPTETNAQGRNDFANDVRTALLARPEIVEEAFYALQAKRQAEADKAKKLAMANAGNALYAEPRDPVIGVDDAPFVVVEFFDYNCGFCKVASEWLQTAVDKHPGKIKVIMKDFPILEARSNGSRLASAAAWAARLQGQDKYTTFHFAMMAARGGFDDARIDSLAKESGVDVARMRADMKTHAKAFEALMEANFALARQLGIDGTPAFITGDTFISGADTDRLQLLLEAKLFEAG